MNFDLTSQKKIAVVIPSYKVSRHILEVLSKIGPEVSLIFVVDDACPDRSGNFVETHCKDPRVKVIRHEKNQGVGGAVLTGYEVAADAGAEVIVKIDGDGQMDPALLPDFIGPIINNEADYTKGNRFFDLEEVRAMPPVRLFGNAVLSLMTKLSSGYWDIFDPTNGYTAIHVDIARRLSRGKISHRYFFETDMLFRLNTLRAVVVDIPMSAVYGDETSHLKIPSIVGEFALKHVRNFLKRLFYNYYLRDVSVASLELPLGIALLIGGTCFGVYHWMQSARFGVLSSAGTVMLSAMPVLMGLQLILSFLAFDISSVPKRIKHSKYRPENRL